MMVYNRKGSLFPRKIANSSGANYAMLSRPSDSGHILFGDIFYSESPGQYALAVRKAVPDMGSRTGGRVWWDSGKHSAAKLDPQRR
jgi:beta-1,4-mannooligosaccharide/beta-1,4-mannosyl-N-acetylglucosamine phosphorylase